MPHVQPPAPVTQEEAAAIQQAMEQYATIVLSIQPDFLQRYILQAVAQLEGKHDAQLMRTYTINQLQTIKHNIKFVSEMAKNVLEMRDVINKYLTEAAQFTDSDEIRKMREKLELPHG